MSTSTAKPKPPNAEEYSSAAEQSLLGAMMLEARAYWRIAGRVRSEDFHWPAHRKLYACIARLIQSGVEADVVTVTEDLDGAVDLAYVASIANNTPSAANIEAYAGIVVDYAKRRRARLTFKKALAQLDEPEPLDHVVAGTMTALQSLSHQDQADTSFSAALDQAQQDAEEAAKRRATGNILGISTTLPNLNRLTGGLHGPKMVVLGGRPGTYKSAFAWQMLLRAAARGTPVGIISLEMGASELAARAIAHELKVSGHDFTSGYSPVVRDVQERLDSAMREWPIRIDDKACRLTEIVARIIEWKYRFDIKLVCIDHLQLIHHDKAANRFLELSETSRQLKLLAMRLNMPILVLSQLSRDVEREKRRPMLSDLRECGNVEQDADVVMFLHCEPGQGQDQDRYELILAKQRGGAARQVIDLVVNGEHFFIGERQ